MAQVQLDDDQQATDARRARIRVLGLVALGIYLVVLAYLTLHPDRPMLHWGRPYNLVPFRSIHRQLIGTDLERRHPWQPVGNLLLLMPLAGYLGVATRWRAATVALACIGTSVGIECLQWVLASGRSADVDDVILNSAGALLTLALARHVRTTRHPTTT